MPERVSAERFVGRADELTALDADSGLVLIAGDAGVGKSRLVGELERRARAAGKLVLVGECVELAEGELPYAAIVSALRPVLRQGEALDALSAGERRELAPLWPELGQLGGAAVDAAPASTGARQGRVFALLLALLVRLAEERPVVFVIEDLHWADRSTRDFLAFLVRAARGERLALVATFRAEDLHRDHPLRPFAAELARVRGVRRIDLRGFTRAELGLQVEDILGERPPGTLVEQLFERTEGNAFYTEELLAAGEDGALPASLRDALLLRTESLSAAARRLLAVAATAERAVDERLLAAVGELPEAAFAPALREALAHHVLVAHGEHGAYAFRHALVREAVYRDLLAGERARLHGALAHTLVQRPELAASGIGVAGELAHHWQAAGEPARALAASVRASAEAEGAFAFAEAERHCERALTLWDRVPDAAAVAGLDRAALLARAATAAIRGDNPQRAVVRAREAIGELDVTREPTRVALMQLLAGRALWLSADHADGLIAYREAVRLVPPEPPSRERALVVAGDAQALMLNGRSEEAYARCEEALALAREVGDRSVEAHVHNTLAGLGWAHGDPVDHAARARAIAVELGAVEEIGRSYANASEGLEQAGRLQDAITLAQDGIALAPRWGMYDFIFYLRYAIAGWLLRLGRIEQAEQLVGDETPHGRSAAAPWHEVKGRLALARGDFATAEHELELARAIAHGLGGPEWYPPALAAIGTLRLWQGRLDDAAAVLRTALDAVADPQVAPWLNDFTEVYPVAARIAAERVAAARAGAAGASAAAVAAARGDAADALARLDAMLATLPASARPPRALACRALAAAEAARAAGGADAAPWAEAADRFRALGEPYPTAYAELRQAEALLAGRGATAAAASLLRDAHATTVQLREQPLRGAIEALGRRARVALGDDAPPPDRIAELGITAREREVLTLLAEGRTNRQIAETLVIAEKTASVHVSRILAKLDARNRGEAAAIARRLGLA
ncbi:helix-turn-helix transcriptional regulator [Conexibacter woesei]|uniref:Transcriptional regulator, LuxR family n=1 Tax=Conexibacter woesei (strain DSM 14684 / CCUG 47730 / CIP 108061 / JCM 11494 / NBRC 100937 / ID131577) TaxID=469383 RepID=D3F768_CONWI|nr:helix-turn-helix transcriptional regulator [Conexibacter woesei]ADB48839.1 transcriptional regulator, LuxR family [Conexibacter woesei DSM 14684]